uniref:Uncharacterized protein n=1 Tax=Romanomermis culicivorax TaxID=13658 RepID=A0A915HTB1_ROMCU
MANALIAQQAATACALSKVGHPVRSVPGHGRRLGTQWIDFPREESSSSCNMFARNLLKLKDEMD